MESGLIFNQLICEFESRHPCQLWANAERDYISKNVWSRSIPCRPFVWVVAQLAEHRTVTAVREGSTPFGPPNSFSVALFSCRRHEMFIDTTRSSEMPSPFYGRQKHYAPKELMNFPRC